MPRSSLLRKKSKPAKAPLGFKPKLGESAKSNRLTDKSVASTTAVAGIAAQIRNLISAGTLLPGEQLRQAELASRLHVSRIPIREALSMLMSEHLIVHHPQRGFFVNKISTDAFRQLRLVRNVLESAALSEMNWPAETEIRTLFHLNEMMHAHGRSGDFATMRELNTQFHDRILGYSRLDLIVSEVRRLRLFVVLYRNLFIWTNAELDRSDNDHLEMIAAIEHKDAQALIAVRNRHTLAFDEQVVSRVQTATD
jgi:DNA-binding GntR family transcriptional regulator